MRGREERGGEGRGEERRREEARGGEGRGGEGRGGQGIKFSNNVQIFILMLLQGNTFCGYFIQIFYAFETQF